MPNDTLLNELCPDEVPDDVPDEVPDDVPDEAAFVDILSLLFFYYFIIFLQMRLYPSMVLKEKKEALFQKR